MTSDQIATLMSAGPLLLRPRDRSPFHCFGFETPSGWYEIVLGVVTKLEAQLGQMAEEDRQRYAVAQVKEKFAGLSFYLEDYTPALRQIIADGDAQAQITCQDCGAPGERRSRGGWLYVACDAHVRP